MLNGSAEAQPGRYTGSYVLKASAVGGVRSQRTQYLIMIPQILCGVLASEAGGYSVDFERSRYRLFAVLCQLAGVHTLTENLNVSI